MLTASKRIVILEERMREGEMKSNRSERANWYCSGSRSQLEHWVQEEEEEKEKKEKEKKITQLKKEYFLR